MSENLNEGTPDEIRAKINRETSKINWQEILPFFAKGVAVYVSHKLDLIDVAYELSQDNKEKFETWMQEGVIANVSDEQAQAWNETNILVWCVVVKPFVLVQPIVD